MTRSPDMPALISMQDRGEAEAKEVVSLTVFVREGKVIWAESQHQFVDLLCTFLAVPLESVCGIINSKQCPTGMP